MKRIALFVCALALCYGIYAQSLTFSGHVTLSGHLNSTPMGGSSPTSANCTTFSVGCTAISMSADPYSTLGHNVGYADPSVYADPNTGTLWHAYSFLTQIQGTYHVAPCDSVTGSWTVIETHLLKSLDSGATWINTGLTTTPTPASGVALGNLFPATAACNLQTNKTDFVNSEVISLIANASGWAAMRLTYWTHTSGGGSSQQPYSVRMAIVMAAGDATHGPMALQTATPAYYYAGTPSSPYFTYFDLTALNSQVSACTTWREPALIWDDGTPTTLDLMLNCGSLAFYAEFQIANAQATSPPWIPTYVNNSKNFAIGADANSLCAYVHACSLVPLRITELNLSPNHANTATEACFTLVDLPGGARHSDGVLCAHLATITPPTFAVDGGSNIIIDATVLSTDSIAGGPGSATYYPTSVTGIIQAHKLTNCTAGVPLCSIQGGFFSTPMQSLLLP